MLEITYMPLKKRIIRLFFGWTFFVLGLLGLVLPVLQGVLFLIVSVILLAPDVPFFKKILDKLKNRYPKLAKKAEKITKRIDD